MTTTATLNNAAGTTLDNSIKKVSDVINDDTLTPGAKVTEMMDANEVKGANESGINFLKAVYQFNGRLGS